MAEATEQQMKSKTELKDCVRKRIREEVDTGDPPAGSGEVAVKVAQSKQARLEGTSGDSVLPRATYDGAHRMLVDLCPLPQSSEQDRHAWALQVVEAVASRHSSAHSVKVHLRNLLSNLRSSGNGLAKYSPAELAALSNEQLAAAQPPDPGIETGINTDSQPTLATICLPCDSFTALLSGLRQNAPRPGSHTNARLAELASALLAERQDLFDLLTKFGFMLGQHASQFDHQLDTSEMLQLAKELEALAQQQAKELEALARRSEISCE